MSVRVPFLLLVLFASSATLTGDCEISFDGSKVIDGPGTACDASADAEGTMKSYGKLLLSEL